MKIQPLDDRVLVKRIEEKEKKVGSIIIPDTARKKPLMGKVIAVGTDEELKEIISKGDLVLFGEYSGNEFEIDGEEYIILQRSDILAKVEKKD